MGAARGKLREWGKYEFGVAVGNFPGHCSACRERHSQTPDGQGGVGIDPPCTTRCPKYKLYPANWGLHPANTLAVHLYYMAARDQRVGMDAVLVGTLTPSDAMAVLDLYADHFPALFHRQRCFELMTVLDHVATKTRAEIEDRKRKDAYEAAKNERQGGRGHRR